MLSDISKELSRLKSLGKKPVMLMASAEVLESIRVEYERIFFKKLGPKDKMLGLELRATIDIQSGTWKIMTEW